QDDANSSTSSFKECSSGRTPEKVEALINDKGLQLKLESRYVDMAILAGICIAENLKSVDYFNAKKLRLAINSSCAGRTFSYKTFGIVPAFPEKRGDVKKKEADIYWNEHKGSVAEINVKIVELKTILAKRKQKTLPEFFAASLKRSAVEAQSIPNGFQWFHKMLKEFLTAATKALDQLKTDLSEEKRFECRLTLLQKCQLRQQKFRDHKKRAFEDLRSENPEAYFSLTKATKTYPGTGGRPSIETQQPLLHQAIIDLISPTAGTHERRSAEMLRTCSTLDELHEGLLQLGTIHI
ncbi:unnamed protein product, partial [Allacma fusca]